ncbi:MAG: hypothetical protein QGF74_01375 [Candidatus Nanoarchaeia archaeon]|jgi:hypothetical protein|nr:hypothetical protein [Candidatus Nanoarchaeia archaeon]|tara:strand:- start:4053 stop:4445 length:393 start_codon:yes stop_codon:yes gene_type:complete
MSELFVYQFELEIKDPSRRCHEGRDRLVSEEELSVEEVIRYIKERFNPYNEMGSDSSKSILILNDGVDCSEEVIHQPKGWSKDHDPNFEFRFNLLGMITEEEFQTARSLLPKLGIQVPDRRSLEQKAEAV